jgi:phosphoglycolate phosphatase-like HAD superfamily hydrolase
MPVLALDFDGVICNSVLETFATAVSTYRGFVPESPLVHRIEARLGAWPWAEAEIATEPDFERFEGILPLGNRAEDFGVTLLSIDLDVTVPDQPAYDRFYQSLEPAWLEAFHRRFYENRASLRREAPDAWLRLHSDYPEFTSMLHDVADDITLAVATAKDGDSLDLLLERFGIGSLVRPELRLDKETGVQKTEHLTRLAERLSVPFDEITFVDDKVNHLVRVSSLGVRPVLAGWGHNTGREHDEAISLGFEVATLQTARLILALPDPA